MPRGLGQELVDEIERLIREGHLSLRGIARQTGVSRGTIRAIARGSHCSKHRIVEDNASLFTGPFLRCPSCGGMVQMPCLLCHTRVTLNGRRRTYDWREYQRLTVDLAEEHRFCYDRVRSIKFEEERQGTP